MKMLNIDSFVSLDNKCIDGQVISNYLTPEYKCYHQIVNEDFTIPLIEEFIQKYILKTNIFNNLNSDVLGIHIRLGDYESSPISNCFDKVKYIRTCINQSNIQKIKVFSDDINKATDIIKDITNKEIISSTNNIDIEDFIELCCTKNKILWNSTFSYWSAFISNVIFPDSYKCIYAPSRFSSKEPKYNHLNPEWNIIDE